MSRRIEMGQTVYWSKKYDQTGTLDSGVVSKIARKWAYISSETHGYEMGRFDVDTLYKDNGGYGAPNKIWLSMQDYEEDMRRMRFLSAIQSFFRDYNLPDKLTVKQLEQVASTVGIEPRP